MKWMFYIITFFLLNLTVQKNNSMFSVAQYWEKMLMINMCVFLFLRRERQWMSLSQMWWSRARITWNKWIWDLKIWLIVGLSLYTIVCIYHKTLFSVIQDSKVVLLKSVSSIFLKNEKCFFELSSIGSYFNAFKTTLPHNTSLVTSFVIISQFSSILLILEIRFFLYAEVCFLLYQLNSNNAAESK